MTQDYYVLGSKVTAMTEDELFSEIDQIVAINGRELILNNNVHGMQLEIDKPWLRDLRNRTRIVHVDGAGIILGAKMLGYNVGPRLSMNDTFWPMIDHLVGSGHSLYMLGGSPEEQEGATKAVKTRAPKLKLAGSHHGHFNREGAENEEVIRQINAAKPNILLVGFGMPIQEDWVANNIEKLDVNVVMVVGGLFYRLSGAVPLAPQWITRHGFEWLYLSLYRPRRFLDRYLVENPAFFFRILMSRFGGNGDKKIQTETM